MLAKLYHDQLSVQVGFHLLGEDKDPWICPEFSTYWKVSLKTAKEWHLYAEADSSFYKGWCFTCTDSKLYDLDFIIQSEWNYETMWNDHCLNIISGLLICAQDVVLYISYYSLMSNFDVNCPDWIFQSKCNKTGTVVICALRRRCLSVFWTALCQQHLLSCCGQYWSSLSMS